MRGNRSLEKAQAAVPYMGCVFNESKSTQTLSVSNTSTFGGAPIAFSKFVYFSKTAGLTSTMEGSNAMDVAFKGVPSYSSMPPRFNHLDFEKARLQRYLMSV